MSLARSKKALEFTTLIEIILLVVGIGLLIGVFVSASSKADDKTSEILCRGSNTLREATSIDTVAKTFRPAPSACKTIDKKELPSKDYKNYVNGAREGTKAEIRDLMAKCWYMWLEGSKKNMFDSRFYNVQNGCFICYTFSIGKEITPFSWGEFYGSLYSPYNAVDSSDKCAGGGGGKCMVSCDKSSEYFPKETSSTKCKSNEKCCIAPDPNDECKNKGGMCLAEPGSEYDTLYNKWKCKSGNCYIKPSNTISFLDYIQSSNQERILSGEKEDYMFKPGQKYAITFVSPGKSWDASTLLGIVTSGGGLYVLGAAAGLGSGIGTIPTVSLIALNVGSIATTLNTGTITESNYILLSHYDSVASKCAIEAGVGQK